jgi:5-methylcytosine-specific restriction enzyme A
MGVVLNRWVCMPGQWVGSDRVHRLPPDWQARCAYVWARDGDTCWICHEHGADEIDHKVHGDDHNVENLAPIHQRNYPHCHRYKSSAEGNAARWRFKRNREPEPHPGYL